MKKSFSKLELFIFLSSLILLLAAFVMNTDKMELLIGAGLIIVLAAIQVRMPGIAGLSEDNPKVKTMRRMNMLCVVFLLLFNMIPLVADAVFGKDVPYQFWLMLAVMIISGNVAPKLPYNRHIGLRLPWTTRDENTWKVANRLLGYLTFPLVFIMCVLYFLLGRQDYILLIGILAWIGIPAIYSFIYARKNRK